jgi:threonyl-tRNA synthetase
MERFVAILLEHTGGNLPLWLAPEQIAILPISEKYMDYAENVLSFLAEHDIRGFVDNRDEKIGRKIRDAEVSKIPYMIIVGEKEAAESSVALRKHGEGDIGTFTQANFVHYFHEQVREQQVIVAVD